MMIKSQLTVDKVTCLNPPESFHCLINSNGKWFQTIKVGHHRGFAGWVSNTKTAIYKLFQHQAELWCNYQIKDFTAWDLTDASAELIWTTYFEQQRLETLVMLTFCGLLLIWGLFPRPAVLVPALVGEERVVCATLDDGRVFVVSVCGAAAQVVLVAFGAGLDPPVWIIEPKPCAFGLWGDGVSAGPQESICRPPDVIAANSAAYRGTTVGSLVFGRSPIFFRSHGICWDAWCCCRSCCCLRSFARLNLVS